MRTVLYIDDDPNDLLLFRSACQLARVSFHLELAAGGVQAIRYLAGQEPFSDRDTHPLPTFILLDLKMPQKDGFDVLHWVRRNTLTSHIPVALYTASLLQQDMIRGFSGGANYFITKPSDVNVMVEIVRAIEASLATDMMECSPLAQFSMTA